MEKSPFIGQMDRKIKIVEVVVERSETGSEKPSADADVANPFAKMDEVSGGEDIEGKPRQVVERSYIIRYNSAVLQKGNQLIVIDGGKRFPVLHVAEIGRKKHLRLKVKWYE